MITKNIKKTTVYKSLMIITILLVVFSGFISVPQTKAGLNLFGNIGDAMQTMNRVHNRESLIKSNAPLRKWTAEELFGGSTYVTTYYGERKDDFFMADTSHREGKYEGSLMQDATVQEKIKDSNFFQALGSGIGASMVNFIQFLSSSVMGITKFFTSTVFDTGFICTNPNDNNCINLVGVIGGRGNGDNGIIGMLTSSIYYPLSILVSAIVGIWVLFQYFVKKTGRDSLMGALWALSAGIVGAILLNAPHLVVKAPQTATSVISTCIVGGLNGKNCLDGTSTGASASTLIGDECTFGTSGGVDSAGMINSLNCSLWKTFVLENYSRAQFGKSYYELYTMNPPANGKIWEVVPEEDRKKYCIHLGSTSPANTKGPINLDSGEVVCNVALYQLYLQTDAYDSVNFGNTHKAYVESGEEDMRWGLLIGPASKDNVVWEKWKPGLGGSFARVGDVFGGLLTSIIASSVFVVISIYALSYLFTAIILTVFAPMFLLFAIHPGKGKRLFLGWLESIVSAVLKYMASALLIVVAMALYSALLQSTQGFMAFITVVILSGSMFMYRKELTNLLGAANLGGERVSNRMADALEKGGQKAREIGGVVAGGYIGAKFAGGSGFEGIKSAVGRNMKRGNGLLSNVARQYSRTSLSPELKEKDENKKAVAEVIQRERLQKTEQESYKKEQERRHAEGKNIETIEDWRKRHQENDTPDNKVNKEVHEAYGVDYEEPYEKSERERLEKEKKAKEESLILEAKEKAREKEEAEAKEKAEREREEKERLEKERKEKEDAEDLANKQTF